MIRHVNSDAPVAIEAPTEKRELSACELDIIGGGFIPGALADASTLRLVTGSDSTSYKD
jgi:hypothetical protein